MEIKEAVGHFIVVEPFDRSTVLNIDETATVVKVISVGKTSEGKFKNNNGKFECFESTLYAIQSTVNVGDIIAVEQHSLRHIMIGKDKMYYVRDTDIVAIVKNV